VLNQTGETGATGVAGPAGPAGIGVKGEQGNPGIGVKGDQGVAGTNGVNATLAITQQAVCDGVDADVIKNEICKIGMTGPSGGRIFFVDYNDEYATYDYLEAAPHSAGQVEWATGGYQLNSIYTDEEVALNLRGAHRGLFGGKAATAAIVARMEQGSGEGSAAKNLYAAGVADDYTLNGVDDWWLPSSDELQKIQENLINRAVSGFPSYSYWSSSEAPSDAGVNSAIHQPWTGTGVESSAKANKYALIPVRGF
jgi:hypothetical protein